MGAAGVHENERKRTGWVGRGDGIDKLNSLSLKRPHNTYTVACCAASKNSTVRDAAGPTTTV